jgi:hypothetical protein
MKTHAKTIENPTIVKLLEACREYPGLDPRDPLDAVADPQWGDASRTNDWRNHIPPSVSELWDGIPLEGRLAAYLMGARDCAFE